MTMVTAQALSKCVAECDPEEMTDLDLAAGVLMDLHRQFGPAQWAQSEPARFVIAMSHMVESCRRFSSPTGWYERLQHAVAAHEASEGRVASVADIGRLLVRIENEPQEQLLRLVRKLVTVGTVQSLLADVEARDEVVRDAVMPTLFKHVPPDASVGASLRDPSTLLEIVGVNTQLLRAAVAAGVSRALGDDPNANMEAIVTRSLVHVGARMPELPESFGREDTITFVAHLAGEYARRCRVFGDPKQWFAETLGYIRSGAYGRRR